MLLNFDWRIRVVFVAQNVGGTAYNSTLHFEAKSSLWRSRWAAPKSEAMAEEKRRLAIQPCNGG